MAMKRFKLRSNFLSCFSCFLVTNSHHASPSSAPPNAASPRVDTETALSSSRDEERTSSSGIRAAVKQRDSHLPDSASLSRVPSPSKVPSASPSIPFEPARGGTVPTEVAEDDTLPDPASTHDIVSNATASQANASLKEKVREGGSSSSRNDDATLQTVPDLSSQIVKDVDGGSVDLDGLMKHITHLLEIIVVTWMPIFHILFHLIFPQRH